MGNGGHMPEDLTFSIIEDGFDYVMRWHSVQVFTNMVKRSVTSSTTDKLYLMGVPRSRAYRSIPISFYVTRKESDGSETEVARSENIAYVSGNHYGMHINNYSLKGLRIQIR